MHEKRRTIHPAEGSRMGQNQKNTSSSESEPEALQQPKGANRAAETLEIAVGVPKKGSETHLAWKTAESEKRPTLNLSFEPG